jgi:hypothetical protein
MPSARRNGGSDSHPLVMQDLDGDHGHFTSVSNSSNDVSVLVPGSYVTQTAIHYPAITKWCG